MRKLLAGLFVGLACVAVFGQGEIQRGNSVFNSPVQIGSSYLVEEAANTLAQRNSTTSQKFSVYNTFTSATSLEAAVIDWKSNANVLAIGSKTGSAGGTGRVTAFFGEGVSAGGNAAIVLNRPSAPFIQIGLFGSEAFSSNDTSGATGTFVQIGQFTSSATSGSVVAVSVNPTYNQASGTADNIDLYVNRTATAIGSGTQYGLVTAVGGSAKFSVGHGGALAFRNKPTITVDSATTFAVANAADGASYIILQCTGAETINTITGAVTGQILIIENTDTDCTIADDDAAVAANAINLTGTATNDVGAAEKIITLIYDGSAWAQIAESDN